MGKKNTRIIVGSAVASLGLFAAVVGGVAAKGGGGDSKAGGLAPASCVGADAFGYAGYNKSGSAVTVGAGASSDNTGGTWTVTITDSIDGVVYSANSGIVGTDWSLIQNYTASKGQHVLSVHMDSEFGGTCDASLSFKN